MKKSVFSYLSGIKNDKEAQGIIKDSTLIMIAKVINGKVYECTFLTPSLKYDMKELQKAIDKSLKFFSKI